MTQSNLTFTENYDIPEGYKKTEFGIIPENWQVNKLGDISTIYSGGTPNRKVNEYWDGSIPWVTTTLINGGEIKEAQEFITTKGYENSSAKWCEKDTILMAMYGQGKTRGKVGKLAFGATINQACAAIKLEDNYNVNYILSFLNSKYEAIRELSNSGGQENLSGSIVKSIPILIPSFKEQQKIATALSDTDALISELEKLIEKKQAIKTATMQQLLTGKTRLPEFALCEDGKPKGYKDSELGQIPEDWDIKSYGEIFKFLSTANNARDDLGEEGDYSYIHYGDIHTKFNECIDCEKVSFPKIDKEKVSSVFVKSGDLVMADASEDYAGIGKSIEMINVNSNMVAGLHTFLLRDEKKYYVDGFKAYLHLIPKVKKSMDRLATGLKVYSLSKTVLKTIFVPIPLKEEQSAIVAFLNDMNLDIEISEQKLAKFKLIKQGVMQELLTGKTRLV